MVAPIMDFCSILAISRSLPVAVEARKMPTLAVRLARSPTGNPQPSVFRRAKAMPKIAYISIVHKGRGEAET